MKFELALEGISTYVTNEKELREFHEDAFDRYGAFRKALGSIDFFYEIVFNEMYLNITCIYKVLECYGLGYIWIRKKTYSKHC